LNGFLLVNKPEGPSSFDVVKITRKALNIRKIGHSGTLDPLASGLMILAVGDATRLLPFLPSEPKTYYFKVQFGETTDSLDRGGDVCERCNIIPTEKEIIASLDHFSGIVTQTPPKYSAIKIKGRRAYHLARRKKDFKIPDKKVKIFSLQLREYDNNRGEAFFKTVCSRGTYIRSLSRDIAEIAGTLGYASKIHRTEIGDFSIKDAVPLKEIELNAKKNIIQIHKAFRSFPSYIASPEQIKDISVGRDIVIDNYNHIWRLFIYSSKKDLVALGEKVSKNRYHPKKVFFRS
jgi:tRNA pseudouridine55 synthase